MSDSISFNKMNLFSLLRFLPTFQLNILIQLFAVVSFSHVTRIKISPRPPAMLTELFLSFPQLPGTSDGST